MSSTATRSHLRSIPMLEGQPGLASSSPGASGDQVPERPRFRPQVIRSVRARPRLAGVVAFVVAALLALYALRQPRLYSAESLIYVEPMMTATLAQPGSGGFDQFRYSSYMEQQLQTVTRPDVIQAALNSLPDRSEWRMADEPEQTAVGRLQKALVVERVLSSYQISIKLSAGKAKTAADVVNAVTRAYLLSGRRDELTQADGRLEALSEERDRLKDELQSARQEQGRLGASLGVANPAGEAGDPYDAQLMNLRTQLAAAREAHALAAAQLDSLGGPGDQKQAGLSAAADEALNSEPGLSSMKNSVNARRAILAGQMAGLTPGNPQYRQDQDEIADLDRSLDAMTARLRGNAERRIEDKLGADLTRTADVESRLNAELAALTVKATGAGPRMQRASELAADIERLTKRYGTVDEALRGLSLETSGPAEAHLVLAAAVPNAPEPSRRKLILLAALPLGMLCGIAAAVLARLRDGRIFRASDLEQVAGFAPIAVLPARADVSTAAFDEYILRLAAGLESAYRTSAARVFVVTAVSAATHTLPLVQALGAKLEDLGLRVDRIAAKDLMTASPGTAEFEAAHADPGSREEPAGEGIASSKLERLKSGFDMILVEAAPLLFSAATEYAARCADATLLVVESGASTGGELEASLHLLSRLHVRGIALVLQDLSVEDADDAFQAAVHALERRNLTPSAGSAFFSARETVNSRREEREPEEADVAVETVNDDAFGVVGWITWSGSGADSGSGPDELEAQPDGIEVPAGLGFGSFAETVLAPAEMPVDVSPDERDFVEDELPIQETIPECVMVPSFTTLPCVAEDLPAEPERVAVAEPGDAEDALAQAAVSLFSGHDGGAGDEREEAPESRECILEDSHDLASPAYSLHLVVASPAEGDTLAESGNLESAVASMAEDSPAQEVQPVGRYLRGDSLAGDNLLSEMTPETRSKIRLAFKEQELTSRTTWFSKLFRGDSPAAFSVVPEGEGGGDAHFAAVEEQPRPVSQVMRPRAQLMQPLHQEPEHPIVQRAPAPARRVELARPVREPLVPPVPAARGHSQSQVKSFAPESTPALFSAPSEPPSFAAEAALEALAPPAREGHEAAVFEWPVRHGMRSDEDSKERGGHLTSRDEIAMTSEVGGGAYFGREAEAAGSAVRPVRMPAGSSSIRPIASSRSLSRGPRMDDGSGLGERPPVITDPQSSRFNPISSVRPATALQRQPRDEAEERFTNAFSSEPLRPRQDRGRMELPVRNSLESAVGRPADASGLRSRASASRASEPVRLAPEPVSGAHAGASASGLTRRWGLLSKFQEGAASEEQASSQDSRQRAPWPEERS